MDGFFFSAIAASSNQGFHLTEGRISEFSKIIALIIVFIESVNPVKSSPSAGETCRWALFGSDDSL